MPELASRKMISLTRETYTRLAKKGTFQDSFDSIVSRLIERDKVAMSGQSLAGSGQTITTVPKSTTTEGADSG